MGISKDQVMKALDSLESKLEEPVTKASEDDLDQPEGADLGNPAKEKMSDMAKKKKAAKSETAAKGDLKIEHEDDDDDEDEEIEMKAKKAKKSETFSGTLPDEVQAKIDVSEFLKSLVDHTASCMDALRVSVNKAVNAQEANHGGLSEAVEELQLSQAKVGIVLKAICERIGILETAPARSPKADTSVVKGKTAEREFASGLAEEGEEKMFKSLSDNPVVAKSQIANALCDMVKKGEATDLDVIGFESANHLRPELVSKLKQALN